MEGNKEIASCLNLLRRLPPSKSEKNAGVLSMLLPD